MSRSYTWLVLGEAPGHSKSVGRDETVTEMGEGGVEGGRAAEIFRRGMFKGMRGRGAEGEERGRSRFS